MLLNANILLYPTMIKFGTHYLDVLNNGCDFKARIYGSYENWGLCILKKHECFWSCGELLHMHSWTHIHYGYPRSHIPEWLLPYLTNATVWKVLYPTLVLAWYKYNGKMPCWEWLLHGDVGSEITCGKTRCSSWLLRDSYSAYEHFIFSIHEYAWLMDL